MSGRAGWDVGGRMGTNGEGLGELRFGHGPAVGGIPRDFILRRGLIVWSCPIPTPGVTLP